MKVLDPVYNGKYSGDRLWIFVLRFEKERDSLGSFYLEGFVLENYWRGALLRYTLLPLRR